MSEDSRVLISICIPTCNQPNDLLLTLKSLVDQELNQVEILIRDDSDNLESEEVVKKFQSLSIKYKKMKKCGIDQAFIWLINNACGDYIWWFGDDIFEKNSIKNVFTNINKFNPDLIYLNSFCIQNMEPSISSNKYFGSDKNYFLGLIKDQMGFCSALVMRSSLLRPCMPDAEKFIGTCWVTLFLSLGVLNTSSAVLFDERYFFKSNYKPPGEVRWYDSYLVHCINYANVLEFYSLQFNKNLIESLIHIKYIASVKAVLSERGKGYKGGYASRGNKILVTIKRFWMKKITYPILFTFLIPNSLMRIIYTIYSNSYKCK
ncbi:Glycosyltransferases involved in cell wall biogenesis [Polynucleobacter duraquae]|uniref:Glycosyltransferases involved in cell wall biogenesis n=1 Tax=Polynucleobacter duraquae TaxID=1835254 RepID=A0A0E3ZL21_9BURK|nr:glycosyltransferase family 2 protein [Polynucleobacter duraquae]AKD24656.1 Glycosyltransferases involved in cell wall biogenesis [Polynucleobacter duraquae]